MTNDTHQSSALDLAIAALQEIADGHGRPDICAREAIALARRAAQPVTPSPQVAEGAEATNAEKAAYWFRTLAECANVLDLPDSEPIPSGVLRAVTELVKEREAIAASRRAAGGEALVSPDEWAALCRFRECCDDFDSGGHDVDKAMMRRLERIGVVRSTGFGRHEMTDFGNWLHDHKEAPAPASAGQAAPASLAARLAALRDEAEAERQSETNPNRERIYMGMREAFNVAAILAAQPAEGAGQASQGYCADCNSWGGSHKGGCQRRPERFFGAGQAGQVAMLRDALLDVRGAIFAAGGGQNPAIKDTVWMPHGGPETVIDFIDNTLADTERAAAPADHEIREAVNKLRDLAVQFHAHQSLRDRIAAVVLPLVRATHQSSAQDGGEA